MNEQQALLPEPDLADFITLPDQGEALTEPASRTYAERWAEAFRRRGIRCAVDHVPEGWIVRCDP